MPTLQIKSPSNMEVMSCLVRDLRSLGALAYFTEAPLSFMVLVLYVVFLVISTVTMA